MNRQEARSRYFNDNAEWLAEMLPAEREETFERHWQHLQCSHATTWEPEPGIRICSACGHVEPTA